MGTRKAKAELLLDARLKNVRTRKAFGYSSVAVVMAVVVGPSPSL